MRDLRHFDRFRDEAFDRRIAGRALRDDERRFGGAFRIPVKTARKPLLVIASSGEMPGAPPWDHVSVSLPFRCPTWEEMDQAKRLFFHPHEVAFQLHPPESDHISNHRYCLHVWRPLNREVPLPPSFMVGIPELGEIYG